MKFLAASFALVGLLASGCGDASLLVGSWTVSKWQFWTTARPLPENRPVERIALGTWIFTREFDAAGTPAYSYTHSLTAKPDIAAVAADGFIAGGAAVTGLWRPRSEQEGVDGADFILAAEGDDRVFAGDWTVVGRGLGYVQIRHVVTIGTESGAALTERSDVFLTVEGAGTLDAQEEAPEAVEAPPFISAGE